MKIIDWIQIWKWNLFNNEKIKKFIISNSIIGTTIGVIIAYSAWDLIQSIVGDIILPGIFFLIINPFIRNGFVSEVFAPVQKLDIPKFIQKILSFIIVVLLVIIIINYIIKNWSDYIEVIKNNSTDNLGNDIINNASPSNSNSNSNSNIDLYKRVYDSEKTKINNIKDEKLWLNQNSPIANNTDSIPYRSYIGYSKLQ